MSIKNENVVEGGELPVKRNEEKEGKDEKDEKDTNEGEGDAADEEEKEAMEIEQKKYIFSDREWKIIVSVIGTGIIIGLILLTLEMINSLLLSSG